MLKPVTKTDSELDKELKELEVENSAGGKDGGGGQTVRETGSQQGL